MNKYKVTLNRVVEHETIYCILASSKEEAVELVLEGNYDEIIHDTEFGEISYTEVNNVEEL